MGLNINESIVVHIGLFMGQGLLELSLYPPQRKSRSRHKIIQAFSGQVGGHQNRSLDWNFKGKTALAQDLLLKSLPKLP